MSLIGAGGVVMIWRVDGDLLIIGSIQTDSID
jgi:hypothetical protein